MGYFPLSVEVIPIAREQSLRRFQLLGAEPQWRKGVVTDNCNNIIDASNLCITDPQDREAMTNQWSGVVTVGIFAAQGAGVYLVSKSYGIKILRFDAIKKI